MQDGLSFDNARISTRTPASEGHGLGLARHPLSGGAAASHRGRRADATIAVKLCGTAQLNSTEHPRRNDLFKGVWRLARSCQLGQDMRLSRRAVGKQGTPYNEMQALPLKLDGHVDKSMPEA